MKLKNGEIAMLLGKRGSLILSLTRKDGSTLEILLSEKFKPVKMSNAQRKELLEFLTRAHNEEDL